MCVFFLGGGIKTELLMQAATGDAPPKAPIALLCPQKITSPETYSPAKACPLLGRGAGLSFLLTLE